jgi:hypothetical protein
MTCYYCGNQRIGCPECRKPAPVWTLVDGQDLIKSMERQPITADREFRQEIQCEWVDTPEDQCPDTQKASSSPQVSNFQLLLDTVASLDPSISVSVVFDTRLNENVVRTFDSVTNGNRAWKWSTLLSESQKLGVGIALRIVQYWQDYRNMRGVLVGHTSLKTP